MGGGFIVSQFRVGDWVEVLSIDGYDYYYEGEFGEITKIYYQTYPQQRLQVTFYSEFAYLEICIFDREELRKVNNPNICRLLYGQ